MTPYEAAAVFSAFEQAGDYESLMWRVDMTPGGSRETKLFATCNDVFFWATADCEDILAEDIPLLERTLADLRQADEEYFLAELFAARKRKLRPQKPFYKGLAAGTVLLFDACCTAEQRAEADRRDRNWWLAFASRQAGTGG